MTVHSTNANNLQAQSDSDEQAVTIEAAENDVLKETQDNRYGAATTARQWQVLSQLQRNRWVGTTHIYEQLMMAGFDISLRTVQRDLNALAKRFPIEKQRQSTRLALEEDAPLQSLPHMNLSQAVAFNMVEANLTQLLPPVILDELFPWFDLARRQLKTVKSRIHG